MKPIRYSIILSVFFLLNLACAPKEKSGKILLQFHAIMGDPFAGSVVVYLTNENRDLYLSMAIAGDQALSIYYAQNSIRPQRPMTHDLFSKFIDTLNYHIDFIDITGLKDDTYYSEIHLKGGENAITLDARPSDAIALALRQEAPIYSHPEVLQPIQAEPRDFAGAKQLDVIKFGMTLQNQTATLRDFFNNVKGLIVTEVRSGRRAGKAGLREGDLIISWDKVEVSDPAELKKIFDQVGKNTIELEILREGKKMRIDL